MDDFAKTLKEKGFAGDIDISMQTREQFSHDASLFEMVPQLVVAPKHGADIGLLVATAISFRDIIPNLSLTARAAGTDMSGGAINESVIVDFKKYFTAIHEVTPTTAHVQPGVFYRDFEVETLKHGSLLPTYPASRDLCTVGGMVNNNSGGEKSLQYGKTEKFVSELSIVLADGKEYTVRPMSRAELDVKMKQNDFEGKLYSDIFALIDSRYDQIMKAKPKVSKDSTGYHLWNVWDKENDVFDISQIIIGAQGTLGLVTDVRFRLVPAPQFSGTLVVFLKRLDNLGDVINRVLTHNPATFEGFDNYTLMLSFKLFFYFHQTLGWAGMIKLAFQLLPNALMLMRGIPKMVLLIEFNGTSPDEVTQKVHAMRIELNEYGHDALFEEDETEAKAKKFWIMRRESFNLLRKKVHDKHTAPFIDDLVVLPKYLPEFLPELRVIINKYKLLATIAGHMGDGNFHVIPLMQIEKESERAKLQPAMKEVNELVLKYGGSLSGEHNDGMVRGPWLEQMYGKEMVEVFREVKRIFDPTNMFNPHKKTDANWEFSMAHIREHF